MNWWIGNTLSKMIPNGDRKENNRTGFTFNTFKSISLWAHLWRIVIWHKIQLRQINLTNSVIRGNAMNGNKIEINISNFWVGFSFANKKL